MIEQTDEKRKGEKSLEEVVKGLYRKPVVKRLAEGGPESAGVPDGNDYYSDAS